MYFFVVLSGSPTRTLLTDETSEFSPGESAPRGRRGDAEARVVGYTMHNPTPTPVFVRVLPHFSSSHSPLKYFLSTAAASGIFCHCYSQL